MGIKRDRRWCCLAQVRRPEPYISAPAKNNGNTGTCEIGHKLKVERTFATDQIVLFLFCDACGTKIGEGELVAYCPPCNYHLCIKCAGRGSAEIDDDVADMEDTSSPQMCRDMAEDARDKIFREAFRALEIVTEKRTVSGSSSSRCDEERSVLHESEAEAQDLSGFEVEEDCQYDRLSEEELEDLWRSMQNRELPSYETARALIQQVREHLRLEASACVHLPRPQGRMIIIGDLHGHASDFWHVLAHHGQPSPKNTFLFNGDFVDRGIWGPEVLFALFVLRLRYPKHVFLNRGNHESELCTSFYGFRTHMACAYPDNHPELLSLIHTAFNQLPLCHLVDQKVLVVHAGLPEFIPSIAEIDALKRGPVPHPCKTQADELFVALLWSDPREKTGASNRGLGWHFDESMTKQFCQENRLEFMVRSHECIDGGYQETHAGLVKTVFSASNYDKTNFANVLIIDQDLKPKAGSLWNEAYIPNDWVKEASASAEDLYVATTVAALERAGGDFTDIAVDLVKEKGAHLGFLVNTKNPNLPLPIVEELKKGLLAEHNRKNPEQEIRFGDAILDVNGQAGNECFKNLRKTTNLTFRFRRPKVVRVRLTAAEVMQLPPSSGLFFTDNKLAFCIEAWGPVTRVDCLCEVNGKRRGEDMTNELLIPNKDMSLVILRYAPDDFVLERQEEFFYSNLRQRAVSDWSGLAGADKHEKVRARLRSVQLSDSDQEDQVLSQVRTIIHLNRAALLEKFLRVDKKASSQSLPHSTWRGTVTPEQWCQVMYSTLDTGSDFPWAGLQPFLCDVQEDGRIDYLNLILRHESLLSSFLLHQWGCAAVDLLGFKIGGAAGEMFDRFDEEGLGQLDFGRFLEIFPGRLWRMAAANKTEQEHRGVLVSSLFTMMNTKSLRGLKSYVSREDFQKVLLRCKTTTSQVCPKGHMLDTRGRDICLPEAYQCDDCQTEIKDRSWVSCEMCDLDICQLCLDRRAVQDFAANELAQRQESKFYRHWNVLRQFLETLSQHFVAALDLFGLQRDDNDDIGRTEFLKVVRDLFPDDREAPETLYETMHLMLQAQNWDETALTRSQTGTHMHEGFTVKQLRLALRVTDLNAMEQSTRFAP